jgi:drug/metabolite transporter (DMT)-like permease
LWLGDKLNYSQILGLVIGFGGVSLLAADKADFKPGGSGWVIIVMLLAALLYGFSTNLTKEILDYVPERGWVLIFLAVETPKNHVKWRFKSHFSR